MKMPLLRCMSPDVADTVAKLHEVRRARNNRIVAKEFSNRWARAGETMDRLRSLYPKWRDSPRRELQKFFPSTDIVDRLTQDLATAHLNATN
jgi:cellulose biosynthesis protein BcsQ